LMSKRYATGLRQHWDFLIAYAMEDQGEIGPQEELNDLAGREADGKKAILPVWHKVGFQQVFTYSPVLADRVAISTDKALEYVVQRILEAAEQGFVQRLGILLGQSARSKAKPFPPQKRKETPRQNR
jgi:hypothetical protein